MKDVKFSLQLQSSIACSPEDCFYQSRFIIPGSTTRGSLATLYFHARGHDDHFVDTFLRGPNRFPFMFLTYDGKPMRYAPLTTAACKRKAGEHGFASRLEELQEWKEPPSCEECGEELKPYRGYLTAKELPCSKNFVGHTAIHDRTNTAAPGAFFRELVIGPREQNGQMHFCGYGRLSAESLQVLQQLCEDHPVMIGKSKSRGRGWAKMTLEEEPREISVTAGDTFTLHCISPLILLDEFLRPTTTPKIRWQGREWTPIAQEISTTTIRGWSVAHGLPKVEDIAVDLGSVFVFSRDSLQDGEEFAKFVREIEENGIGQRKNEGFGQVVIDDPVVTKPSGGE